MASIEISRMPVLNGQEAVEFLNQLMEEFQQQKGKRLTDKQAQALTKAASQMIVTIRAEKSTGKLHISNHRGFFMWLRSSQRSR